MRKLCRYVYLQGKRTVRYLPFVLAITLVICLALGLILASLISLEADSEKNDKVAIGVVGDTGESFLGFGVAAIQSLDSSRDSLDLVNMTESEARRALLDGELAAYLVIPEGFVSSAVKGEIKPISYVTTGFGMDMASLFKEEILAAISRMLVESQKGVYGLESAMRENGVAVGGSLDRLASEYFSLILNRSRILETEVIGVSDGLSLGPYMLCGLFVLLILMSGIPCCSLLVRRDMALARLMNARRRGVWHQIVGEYTPYFLMMLLNFSLLSAIVLPIAVDVALLPELTEVDGEWLIQLFYRLIPILLALTAMQFLLYELSTGLVGGVLSQFLAAIALGYVSGCMYPIGFFPDSIRSLSSVLPTGLARGCLASLFSGASMTVQVVGLLAYTLLFLALASGIRRYRIERM